MLKKTERLSLVEQVVIQIEQLIESGHWKIGEQLPAEMHLMKEFDVSRIKFGWNSNSEPQILNSDQSHVKRTYFHKPSI